MAKTGFVFDGWYTAARINAPGLAGEEAFTTPWNFDTGMVTADTLYARWIAAYTGLAAYLAALPANTPVFLALPPDQRNR